jgi:hypothetical protein
MELRRVATSCAALQRAVPRCHELRCVATCCAALQRAALRCNVLCFAVLQPRRRSCPLGTTRLKRARTRARHTHSTPPYHVCMRNDGTPHDRRRAVRSRASALPMPVGRSAAQTRPTCRSPQSPHIRPTLHGLRSHDGRLTSDASRRRIGLSEGTHRRHRRAGGSTRLVPA